MDRAPCHIAIAREVKMKKHICTGLWLRSVATGVLGVLVCLPLMAQTVVEAVTGSIQGGVEVIRVDFSQPLSAVPAGFAIQAPARVALDIPGATNGVGRSSVEINQGNV